MDIIKKILEESQNIDYVVRGGRSYLSKIPLKYLKVLNIVLPEYFNISKSDWNISIKDTSNFNKLLASFETAFKQKNITYKKDIINNEKGYKLNIFVNNIQICSMIDISKGRIGKTHEQCLGIVIKNKIKYSSLCDCFAQLNRALNSETFTKKLKTTIRKQVLSNLFEKSLLTVAYMGKNKTV